MNKPSISTPNDTMKMTTENQPSESAIATCSPFLIFCGNNYYASGGGRDYYKSADTLDKAIGLSGEALGMAKIIEADENPDDELTSQIEWVHVLDARTGKIVHRQGGNAYGSDSEGYRKADSYGF